ncbi:signal transduction histidine kinase [Streptomyces aurantiacus]|uniref:sensor histidine kinase n=1 Tax=Streptomyces aurantiacus TaxID=47760 RepID=UPI00278F5145|nr:histidine kinase [Streptomyces aurantiacus]MDQ0774818.1 signal transduction histidine kinase [Streptomyces aurantiacus]
MTTTWTLRWATRPFEGPRRGLFKGRGELRAQPQRTRRLRTSLPAGGIAGRTGYFADDAAAPGSLRLQLNALQALCRQAFAVRLTLIAIGAPFATANATDGLPRYGVLTAAVLGVMGSYAMLRDWDRFAPRLLAHPTLMAVDLVFGAILLLTASPASPLAYAAVCTPLLAGLLYGWRGSGVFTGLQLVVLLTVFRAWEQRPGTGVSTLLIAGFCVAAGIIGVTLRNLMFHFGTASQALAEANSRLAVAEAVESERARLAREMHDSVAKTLHGLALSAEALAVAADHDTDPRALKSQASAVAGAARRAAAESRELLTDLRAHTALSSPPTDPPTDLTTDLVSELAARVADFGSRTGLTATFAHEGAAATLVLPPGSPRQLLAIVAEALENAHRHAHATRVDVTLDASDSRLRLTVQDDGTGTPVSLNDLDDLDAFEDVQALTKTGHFGLLGMLERAASVGAALQLHGAKVEGTKVTVTLPLPSLPSPMSARPSHTSQEEAAHV